MAGQDINSDILAQLKAQQATQEETMRNINISLQHIAESMSLAEYENMRGARRYDDRDRSYSRDTDDDDKWKVNRDRRGGRSRGFDGIIDDFTSGLVGQLEEALLGSSLSDMVKESLSNFANALGSNVDDLGKDLGKMAGNSVAKMIQSGPLGGMFDSLKGAKADFADGVNNLFNDAAKRVNPGMFTEAAEGAEAAAHASTALAQGVGKALPEVTNLAGGMAGAAEGAAAASMALPGIGIAVGVALIALDLWTEVIGESWEETKKAAKEYADAMDDASHRVEKMMKFKTDEKIKRLEADFKSMVEATYNVMEEASQQMLAAWDDSLRKITATQGYDKAGMQDLLSNYAQRLRDEGLSSVVSTADITKNLTQVLDSGLSGAVAEEFAYLATVLNAAIPTEDFFQYASTYASVAANAIAAGKSQQEAIDYANQELEQFASNLLYSSRELAGGFSTGLKNASSLFESANKIAVASRKGQASEISGVLTAVSAAVGAVAPDLASGLVDNVVNAALSGNSESVTALRSLSGVGASNTAFLEALATNAQGVFENLFKNLAGLQSMSRDNYMEVAEGLSQIFGVSMDAFARVDFSYLADVIGAMSIDGDSLGQNLSLLVSGQTTYTAEQARIAEVNKVMIEEGLAYVLDNEVARSIQENMWAEQRAQEIMETEYAVNLQGTALKLIQTIADLVENILDFLNPLSWMKDGVELINTMADSAYRQQEIEKLLKSTVVGTGNEQSYYNLTHRGTDLQLTQSYLERLGIEGPRSAASYLKNSTDAMITAFGVIDMIRGASYSSEARNAAGQIGTFFGQRGGLGGMVTDAVNNAFGIGGTKNAVASSYTWGTVGKSSLVSSGYGAGRGASPYTALSAETAQQSMTSASQRQLQDLLNTMQTYVDDQKSFSDWEKSATKFGIVDLEQALSDFDITMEDVKGQFRDLETQAGVKYQHDMQEREQEFYETSITWFTETYPDDLEDMTDLLLDMHEELMDQLVKSHRQLQDFFNEWVDYYVNHTAYSQETLDAYNVAAIRTAERAEVGDSVLALAEALTETSVDLKDPAVQTNVLLAKILIVAEAIMQQTNDTTTVSLPTALASLGLGLPSDTPNLK